MSCLFAIKPRGYSITNTQTPTLEHRYRTKKDRKKNKNFVKPDDPELDHSIYDESGKKLIERETMKFCTNFKKLLENNGVVYMIELDSIHNGIRHVLVRSSTLSLISNGTWSWEVFEHTNSLVSLIAYSFATKPREYSITNTRTPTLERRYLLPSALRWHFVLTWD